VYDLVAKGLALTLVELVDGLELGGVLGDECTWGKGSA
jgi:hypothetical protein